MLSYLNIISIILVNIKITNPYLNIILPAYILAFLKMVSFFIAAGVLQPIHLFFFGVFVFIPIPNPTSRIGMQSVKNISKLLIIISFSTQRELEEPHFNNNILSKLSPLAHHHFTVNTAPTTANTTTATPANVATAAFAYPIALATPSAFPTQFSPSEICCKFFFLSSSK